MPTKSRAQIGLVLTIVAVALFQMFSVTFAAIPTNAIPTNAIPTNKVSTKLSSTTAYLNPFFTQNWRLFAPNPIAEDRTEWINWTNIELDLVRHKIVGGRVGYVTNKMTDPLENGFFALGLPQRKVADDDKSTALDGYAALRKKLIDSGGDAAHVDFFLRYEESAIRLGTSVLEAVHPGTTFTAVRYRIVRRAVLPSNTPGTATRRCRRGSTTVSATSVLRGSRRKRS